MLLKLCRQHIETILESVDQLEPSHLACLLHWWLGATPKLEASTSNHSRHRFHARCTRRLGGPNIIHELEGLHSFAQRDVWFALLAGREGKRLRRSPCACGHAPDCRMSCSSRNLHIGAPGTPSAHLNTAARLTSWPSVSLVEHHRLHLRDEIGVGAQLAQSFLSSADRTAKGGGFKLHPKVGHDLLKTGFKPSCVCPLAALTFRFLLSCSALCCCCMRLAAAATAPLSFHHPTTQRDELLHSFLDWLELLLHFQQVFLVDAAGNLL